jgi:hypothetical protein
MRKIAVSSTFRRSTRFRCCADCRSFANGFSTMTRAPVEQPQRDQLFEHSFEHCWRAREIVRWPLCRFQFLAQGFERCRMLIISINVAEQTRELLERSRIDSTVFLEAIVGPRLELVERPTGFGDPDDWHIEVAASPLPAAQEISSCRPDRRWHRRRPARPNGRSSWSSPHATLDLLSGFSKCPPN